MERQFLLLESEVKMHLHKISSLQTPCGRLCATYFNCICVLEIKALFAQTKKGAG